MSAPLFLVPDLPPGDVHRLDGPEGHHAATVQRLRAGERLLLADGRGGTAEARVTAAGRDTLDLAIVDRRYEPAPDPRVVVIQGIAKGERGELAVAAMTEAGVDEIVPWAATRSVVAWRGERGDRAARRWESTGREAAKQARRAWLPAFGPAVTTAGAAARLASATTALVLHEAAVEALAAVRPAGTGEIVLVVGPEGGITPDELAAFAAAGARPVRLGGTVLRTSTAGVAALAVLSVRLGRW